MQQCRHQACPESKHHCNKKTADGCLGGDDDQRVPVPSCCTKTNTRVLWPQSHQSLPQSSSQDFLTFPLSAALFLHILSNRLFFTFSATAVSSLSQQQQQKLCFSSSADDRSTADFLRSEGWFILEDLDPEPNASDHVPCSFVLFTSRPILAHRFSQNFRLMTLHMAFWRHQLLWRPNKKPFFLYDNQSGRRNNSNKDLSFRIPRCCCCCVCSPSPPPLGTPHDMAVERIVLFVVIVVPTVDRSKLARYVLF